MSDSDSVQLNTRVRPDVKERLKKVMKQEDMSFPALLEVMLEIWERDRKPSSTRVFASAPAAASPSPAAHSLAPAPMKPAEVDLYALVDYRPAANPEEEAAWRELNALKQAHMSATPAGYETFLEVMEKRRAIAAKQAARQAAECSATPVSVETAGHPGRGLERIKQEDDAKALADALQSATSGLYTSASAGYAAAAADDLW